MVTICMFLVPCSCPNLICRDAIGQHNDAMPYFSPLRRRLQFAALCSSPIVLHTDIEAVHWKGLVIAVFGWDRPYIISVESGNNTENSHCLNESIPRDGIEPQHVHVFRESAIQAEFCRINRHRMWKIVTYCTAWIIFSQCQHNFL